MDIGFGAPIAGAWATPRNLTEFGRRAERLGYRSLWTFQRLLIPAGSRMAPVYQSVLDPMVSLGFLAAATSSIRLGVAVVNHPFASPLLLAKQAATVDVLSGGRLDLGIGSGWLPEEFTGSGASMARRGPRTEEYLAALRAVWTSDAGFTGTYYTIPPGRQDPPPVQQPGPPILLGGMSLAGDGAGRADRRRMGHREQRRPVADRGGREDRPGDRRGGGARPVRIVCRGVVRAGKEVRSESGQRLLLSGSYQQIRADVAWLESCGVTEVFYDLNWDPAVGDPAAKEGAAVLRASEVLEELAPGAPGAPGGRR